MMSSLQANIRMSKATQLVSNKAIFITVRRLHPSSSIQTPISLIPRLSIPPLTCFPESDVNWVNCPMIELLPIPFMILPRCIDIKRCSVGTPSTSSLSRDWMLYKSEGRAPLGKMVFRRRHTVAAGTAGVPCRAERL